MNKGEVMEFDYIYKLKNKYYNCFWLDLVWKREEHEEGNLEQINER
jgi:hypothetical protein